jgi:hypothetical protein
VEYYLEIEKQSHAKQFWQNKHIPVSAQCPLCEISVEDTKHMLFQCPRAKAVWRRLGLEELIARASKVDRTGQAVLDCLLCNKHTITPILGQSKLPELVGIICWYMWWERRQATHGEELKEVAQTAIAIGAPYSNSVPVHSPKQKMRKVGWTKPLHNFVKLNVYACFDADDMRGTTWAVLQDCHGSFLAARVRSIFLSMPCQRR